MADKIKLFAAFMLVAAGIAGYYFLGDSAAVLKFMSVLVGVVAAAGVAYTSEPGKRFFSFGKESIVESKRVVWPSRKETMQTTGIVVIFAVVMALFLWGVDSVLMLIVDGLMGRGG